MTGKLPSTFVSVPTLEPINEQAYPQWNTAKVRRAFVEAQDGQLELVADLCEALKSDARIRGVIQTRINALLGSAVSFECIGPEPKNEVTKALEEDGEWWDIAPEPVLGQILFWGLFLNLAIAEIVWEEDPERGGRLSPRLHVKNPRNLRFDHDTRTWKLKVATKARGTIGAWDIEEIEVTPGDGRWFFYQPYGTNTPWLHGLVWPIALTFLAKSFSEYDWGRRNEARGRAALVGETPEGSLDSDRELFAQQIAQLRENLGIALAPGFKLSAIEFGGDDHESFNVKIQNANSDYAIIILGQNLTTEVRNAGSYAAGRAQERVRQDYLEQDAENAATQWRKQLLIHFARVRYGDVKKAPFPKYDTTPPESTQHQANVMARATEALDRLLANGVDVDIEAYAKRFAIPIKSARIKKPEPAPAPARAPKPEKPKPAP